MTVVYAVKDAAEEGNHTSFFCSYISNIIVNGS